MGIPSPPLPSQPQHATRVWDAILAIELPLDDPLAVAPVYWQKFVLQQAAGPSVADLCMEIFNMLWMGLEEAIAVYGAIGWSGTLEV